MIDCTNVRMREALPEYMHGLLDSRERLLVQAHLTACADCAAELAVLERCRTAMSAAPKVDIGRIVAALPAPPGRTPRADAAPTSWAVPRQAPAPRPTGPAQRADGGDGAGSGIVELRRFRARRLAWRVARVAAVVLLAVGSLAVVVGERGHWAVTDGMFGVRLGRGAGPDGGGDQSRSGDSVMLAAGGLGGETARRSGGQRDDASLSLAGGLSELSDAALTALLGEVDGVEALPLVEPPPVSALVLADELGAL